MFIQKVLTSFLFSVALFFSVFGQKSFFFERQLTDNPEGIFPVCIKNTPENLAFLTKEKYTIKQITAHWIFFNSSAKWLDDQVKNKTISDFYFEFAPPSILADSAVVRHKINLVHQGLDLDTSYTGKGIIVGIVDQGIDFNHPDFKSSNGKTRVLRYWDHTVNAISPPQPYGYGTLWDSTAINNGTCTSLETISAHGTSVSGMAVGNARANSKNKGAAPEADIIVVETDFNLPNWTLSIADACDYIFKVADSLGKPAVINLSLGSYLGSHDGRDPAAEYIDSLLDASSGRIVVCAAGNSGNRGKYHVTGIVDQDTSFVWNKNNPGNTYIGTNKILFDMWTDTAETNFSFAYGADLPAPIYGLRGRTTFRNLTANMDQLPLYDTIYNAAGNRIACIETYREFVGPNFHMQTLFTQIDSLNYLFRFETVGNGKYDLWGGAWQQLSDFETVIPSVATWPTIAHYHMPDSLQTIVSSWNCSEKVISVGNITNRNSYIDKNNVTQIGTTNPIGQLSPTSSKGPNRLGAMKPDVSASGDLSFGSGPMWYLSNSANNQNIEQGGFHIRNGGTSMASPVVAGSAALYLQKCSGLTYQDFKSDLQLASLADAQTGITPNFGYGYGKLNAHALVLLKHQPVTIQGPSGICLGSSINLSYSSSMVPTSINWSNGSTTNSISTSSSGNFSVSLLDAQGCRTKSPVKNIQLYQLPFVDAGPNHILCPNEPFTLTGSGTASTYSWSNNIQNNTSFIPELSGFYYLTGVDLNGCSNMDSTFLDFYTLMPVEYTEGVSEIELNAQAFNVSAGIPGGGTYSGTGIIGTSFHPGLAGEGTYAIIYSVQNTNGCFSTDTSYITVLSSGGLEAQNQFYVLYPNPTQSNLTILSALDLKSGLVYSADGKQIMSVDLSVNRSLDVQLLEPGVYYLVLESEIGTSEMKFIKVN
jgi:subtilisin family serine protease